MADARRPEPREPFIPGPSSFHEFLKDLPQQKPGVVDHYKKMVNDALSGQLGQLGRIFNGISLSY